MRTYLLPIIVVSTVVNSAHPTLPTMMSQLLVVTSKLLLLLSAAGIVELVVEGAWSVSAWSASA